jgi:hypothetical protein
MSGRVILVMGGGRGRWFVVVLVRCVIHAGHLLRYSPPVSPTRQDRRPPSWPVCRYGAQEDVEIAAETGTFGRRMLRVPDRKGSWAEMSIGVG